MLPALRRLTLGFLLIATASAILLYADRGRRIDASVKERTADKVYRIGILQHVDSQTMEEGVRGVIAALADRGYRNGERVTIQRFSAQGDIATGDTIARRLVGGDYDLVITSSTPSAQNVAATNRAAHVPHVFALVSDPFLSLSLDRAKPFAHPPYMSGHGIAPAVALAFDTARRLFPGLARVGVPWNPAESNSEACIQMGRDAAARLGITLLEANADSTSAVSDAVNSLIARNAQAIWIPADNTIATTVDTIIAIGRRAGLPLFSVLPGRPDRGTFFDVGFDFYDVGRAGGLMAADVLDGADLAKIPIIDLVEIIPPFVSINTTVLKELPSGWTLPDDLRNEANIIVDASGVHRKTTSAQ